MKERTWLILCSRFIIALLALGFFPFVFNNFPDIRYIFLVCSLGFYGALWLISNEKKMQRKYERKADDLAVDLVGSECYAHMLELLHSINMIPRNFSENNKKYSSHPDLEERKNNIQKGLV
jgi:Zn-dependent protease with chaperone function